MRRLYGLLRTGGGAILATKLTTEPSIGSPSSKYCAAWMPYPHDMVCESLKFPAPGSCQPNSSQSFVLVCQTFAFEIYGSWGSFLLHLILWGHRLSSSSMFGHIVPGLNAQHVKFHLLSSWCLRLTGLKIRRAQCQLPCTVGRQFLGFRSA